MVCCLVDEELGVNGVDMKVTLKVTQKHVDEGAQASCDSCPVALALQEIVKPVYSAHISYRMRLFEDASNRIIWSIPTPWTAAIWINEFYWPCDSELKVNPRPFECEIDIPKELLR